MKTFKRFIYLALALLITATALLSCSSEKKDYIVLDDHFGEEFYGIGFRLGDNTLTLKVQSILDEMIADGTFAEISTKWFGKDVSIKDASFPRAIEDTGDGSLDYILNNGKLILGLDESFPPMGFRDESGEIIGFDIDLAKEVCSRLGVELVLQPIEWSAKELELSSKSIDCIWNGMSITDERVAAMNITKPYIANRQVIAVAADSGIAAKADLAGKIVATQSGSAALDAINAATDISSTFAKIAEYASFDDAYLDLKAGSVDALVIDEVYIRYVIENDK
jgi:ABC-type amino acid transport substrate-binding protein